MGKKRRTKSALQNKREKLRKEIRKLERQGFKIDPEVKSNLFNIDLKSANEVLNNIHNFVLNVDENGVVIYPTEPFIPTVDSIVVQNVRERLNQLRSSLDEKSELIDIFERSYKEAGEPAFSERLQRNAEKLNDLLMKLQFNYEVKATQGAVTEASQIFKGKEKLTLEEMIALGQEAEANETYTETF